MTTAQIIFSVALGLITLIITLFAAFVVSTTTWSGRWVRKSRPIKRRPSEGSGNQETR